LALSQPPNYDSQLLLRALSNGLAYTFPEPTVVTTPLATPMVPIRRWKFLAYGLALRIDIDGWRVAVTMTGRSWCGGMIFHPVRTTSTNWPSMMHSDNSGACTLLSSA